MSEAFKNKKHLFFDLDDTVTHTRTPMEDHIYELYASLPHDIIIVSGAQASQIEKQVRDLPFFKLGQNGNQAIHKDKTLIWEEVLDEDRTQVVNDHIGRIKSLFPREVKDHNDLVEHRGSQISYSLIGHNEDIANKKACDPDKALRSAILEAIPLESDLIEVKIGGTTCFDYFKKGRHKGYNVEKLINSLGWDKQNCIYFGDALFPGGNDETVIGVIDTHPVDNHLHTFEILKSNFK